MNEHLDPPVEPTPATPRRSRPRRSYTRHGYRALKRRVLIFGNDAVDKRTTGGREIALWIEGQLNHLGGKDEVTHPELTLVKRASVLEVLIRHVETDILGRGILLGRGKSKPHPLLADYRQLLREQRETLTLLGLKRRPKKIVSLNEYVEKKYPTDKSPLENPSTLNGSPKLKEPDIALDHGSPPVTQGNGHPTSPTGDAEVS
jgi:hypothetical protein